MKIYRYRILGGAAGTVAVMALVTLGGADAALAGAHGGDHCQCSPTPTASSTPSPTPSPTPDASDNDGGGGSDQASSGDDSGDVAGASTQTPQPSLAASASPSAPASESTGGLPDTGPVATFGGMAGAAGVSCATYAYLRSRRRVQGALKNQTGR